MPAVEPRRANCDPRGGLEDTKAPWVNPELHGIAAAPMGDGMKPPDAELAALAACLRILTLAELITLRERFIAACEHPVEIAMINREIEQRRLLK